MSESEEMYLVTVAMLEEAGVRTPVQVSVLAKELSIQSVSANQMIRRLEESDLVTYAPYKGVTLTDEGKNIALRVLRHRRLWEVFLVEKLSVPIDAARELACQMEHIAPEEVMSQLAVYLGQPTLNPEGKLIPHDGYEVHMNLDVSLNQLKAGDQGVVSRIEADEATRSFLAQEGVFPGVSLSLTGIGGDGNLLVEANHTSVYLTAHVAETIWVSTRPIST
jgi:DtxR family transcriptional regulator, Mn-dependent transcriptional regulator